MVNFYSYFVDFNKRMSPVFYFLKYIGNGNYTKNSC